jgi:YHS domain-containing protein
MVNDPVCGMAVFEANAKIIYQGQTYYFCSTLCKQLSEREPQKHILPHGGVHL